MSAALFVIRTKILQQVVIGHDGCIHSACKRLQIGLRIVNRRFNSQFIAFPTLVRISWSRRKRVFDRLTAAEKNLAHLCIAEFETFAKFGR
jgi:hypothetical protein